MSWNRWQYMSTEVHRIFLMLTSSHLDLIADIYEKQVQMVVLSLRWKEPHEVCIIAPSSPPERRSATESMALQ